ncbi:cell envelope integrity protein TolA [Oleiphilus messinensis]|uniref:cell envelope integrity protein TolA n=1 Tax=Oleiphilus messinensis TaxID=141451 RepID=UPI0012FADAD4|nr:cell envelope integrity protein TolA [Oleiphilus messinensis]
MSQASENISYLKSFLFSAGLHLVLIVAITLGWKISLEPDEIAAPKHIKAVIFDASMLEAMRKQVPPPAEVTLPVKPEEKRPEPKKPEEDKQKLLEQQKAQERQKQEAERQKAQEKARQETLRKEQEAIRLKKEKDEKVRQEKLKKEREEKARREQAQKEKARQEKERQEKLEREREKQALEKRQERERMLAEQARKAREDSLKQAAEEAEKARKAEEVSRAMEAQRIAEASLLDRYMSLIQSRIRQKWFKPASAEPGMQVYLSIRLLPTGELVSAEVTRSSGNQAFDNSALSAANAIRNYPVPDDSRVFEKHFRKFTLIFNPKEL